MWFAKDPKICTYIHFIYRHGKKPDKTYSNIVNRYRYSPRLFLTRAKKKHALKKNAW